MKQPKFTKVLVTSSFHGAFVSSPAKKPFLALILPYLRYLDLRILLKESIFEGFIEKASLKCTTKGVIIQAIRLK